MKILFYNHTGEISGAERVLLMILRGLDSGVDSVVVCPPNGRLVEMVRELRVRTVPVDPLAARFTWRLDRLIRYFVSFRRVIRTVRAIVVAEAPDLVHANSIRGGLVMSAATVGLAVPIVWHTHDLLPQHPLSTAIRLFASATNRNRILAVSHAVADRFRGTLLRWFHKRVPIVTIHNAVDLKQFYPHPESRNQLRRALGFDDEQLLVGIVGQLTPRKGQLELIQAFTKVAREIPKAVLLIIGKALFNGDEEYAALLVRAANASGVAGRIHFLGSREDVPALMRAFDLLVVNSRAEPFGLTVVEAMASGTPVLATAVDGITEIIDHAESGWLIETRDQVALAESMIKLLDDANRRGQLGRRGRATAIARFSGERFLGEIHSLYRSMLGSGTTPRRESARRFETKLSAD